MIIVGQIVEFVFGLLQASASFQTMVYDILDEIPA